MIRFIGALIISAVISYLLGAAIPQLSSASSGRKPTLELSGVTTPDLPTPFACLEQDLPCSH